jgi:D-glycero-D-manno-heptose 1,7-bisphosphate phosphatase
MSALGFDMPFPAVFLDRDGTLIEEAGYLDSVERMVLFPWSVDAVRLLNRAGFKVVVISNQAGVARGFFDEAFVRMAHQDLANRLASAGGRIDGFYFCPHHPEAPVEAFRTHCDCRKPKPGLILQAARELDLNLERSYMVGDRWLDVNCGRAAGTQSVLVRTGYGRTEELLRRPPDQEPTPIADNLIEAVGWILGRPRRRASA